MSADQTILIVDDDPHIREVVRFALHKAGYHTVEAADGHAALARFAETAPDLVVLDIIMPELDGTEVCRQIRAHSRVPIVFLSSRDDEVDRIVGLELGGDDYVTKPFSPRELIARVRAVLRRAQAPPELPPVLRIGPLIMDRATHTVTVSGRPANLTPTEFGILETLMTNPGRVFRRDELLETVQGVAFEAYERTVDAHIKNLRRKIEPDPAHPRYILTVRGIGYRMNPEPEDA
jgi:two-component system OmpR family response regulator